MKKHCALSGVLLAGTAILCLAARSWAIPPPPEYRLEVKVSQDADWTFVEGVASLPEAKKRLHDLEQSGHYFAVRFVGAWIVPGMNCLAPCSFMVPTEYLLEVKVSQDAGWTFVEGVASFPEAKKRLHNLEQSGYYFAVRSVGAWTVHGSNYFLEVKLDRDTDWQRIEVVRRLFQEKNRLLHLEESGHYFAVRINRVLPPPTEYLSYSLEVKLNHDANWTFVERVVGFSKAKNRLRDLEESGCYFAARLRQVSHTPVRSTMDIWPIPVYSPHQPPERARPVNWLNPHVLAESHLRHAEWLLARGEPTKALQYFGFAQMGGSNRTNPNYFYGRGRAQRLVGNLGQAIRDFDKAISLKPGVAAFHWTRGLALLDLRKYPEATTDLWAAVRIRVTRLLHTSSSHP